MSRSLTQALVSLPLLPFPPLAVGFFAVVLNFVLGYGLPA